MLVAPPSPWAVRDVSMGMGNNSLLVTSSDAPVGIMRVYILRECPWLDCGMQTPVPAWPCSVLPPGGRARAAALPRITSENERSWRRSGGRVAATGIYGG